MTPSLRSNLRGRLLAVTAAALVFAVALVPISARAESNAEEVLAKVRETLSKAQTLSASFTISTVYAARYSDTQEQGTVKLSKPGRARIEITRYRKPVDDDRWVASGNGSTVVADGHSVSTLIWHPLSAQIRTVEAQQASPASVLAGLEPLQGFFGEVSSASIVRSLGERTWQNGRYEVIEEKTPEGAIRELYVGSDNLIHRLTTRQRTHGKEATRDVELRDLRINPPIDVDTYKFNAPEGAVPIEPAARQKLLGVGSDAPDFSAEDANGKTVHLSDFRGKLVLLKFFATWCWTCKQSLPDTNRLASHYAAQDVVVLAVDIWNSREAFRNWKDSKLYPSIVFAHDNRPQGRDAASALFHVSATPTEFLIDKDGRIAAVHSGYEGPDDSLERAVAVKVTAAN